MTIDDFLKRNFPLGSKIKAEHPAEKEENATVISFSADMRGRLNGIIVKFDDSTFLEIPVGYLPQEETLSVLSRVFNIREDTLLKAAQSRRLIARKSGSTWLSTIHAVEWAIEEGTLRSRRDK